MPKIDSIFSNKLIDWYLDNKRELPWRTTKLPYNIWLSEIILQQTRVAQGLPYYLKFIKNYPNVGALANAHESEVLKLWQGLGYYSRARNMHKTAKHITSNLDGNFPNTYNELLELKGIGDYTASAIASICFNEPTAVVDGNVYRVLSRYFEIYTPINSAKGIADFKALAQSLIDRERPGTYNQAIMEFGARHCTPRNPKCESCVLNDGCLSYSNKVVEKLPVKHKKTNIKKRYFNYLVFLSEDNQTLIQQRLEKGIWQQLYQFPLVESDKEINMNEVQESEEYKKATQKLKVLSITKFNDAAVIHKLSHQHLITTFWIVETSSLNTRGVKTDNLKEYAVPVLIDNFISEFEAFKN